MAIGSIFVVGVMPVGWIFVVVAGLAPSCSFDQTDGGYLAGTVDSVEAKSAATNGGVAGSSDVVASTQLQQTDGTTADVLVAVAAFPLPKQQLRRQRLFTTVYVVERLGEADDVGFITFADTAPPSPTFSDVRSRLRWNRGRGWTAWSRPSDRASGDGPRSTRRGHAC